MHIHTFSASFSTFCMNVGVALLGILGVILSWAAIGRMARPLHRKLFPDNSFGPSDWTNAKDVFAFYTAFGFIIFNLTGFLFFAVLPTLAAFGGAIRG